MDGLERWRQQLRPADRAERGLGRVAAWAYPLSLILWASTWYLRNSVVFAWSPVEPIWLGSAAVVLCVIHRMGQRAPLRAAAFLPLLVLVVTFAPGAWHVTTSGYGPTKLAELSMVTLPMFAAAVLLLDSRASRVRWLWVQALMGVVVAVATLRYSDATALLTTGRLKLETVDTISTGRLIAIGAVVLILAALTGLRQRWWLLLPGGFLAVVAVQVGSRGPVLFMVVSIVAALLLSRDHSGRGGWTRLAPVAVLAGLLVAGYNYLESGRGGGGAARVLESSREGFSDEARAELLDEAIRIGYAHPGGVGWGDFAGHSRFAAQLANDQGNVYAHNVLAEAFAEGGLIALAGLAGVIGYAMWRLQRSTRDPMMMIAFGAAVYWLLNAMVSYDLVGNRFLWIALAVGLTTGFGTPEHADQDRARPEGRPEPVNARR